MVPTEAGQDQDLIIEFELPLSGRMLIFQPYLEITMKLLNTYDDREEAEEAERKLSGERRLASERDATVVIYNLFGVPSWGNFYRLGMYNLGELKALLGCRADWCIQDVERHREILSVLQVAAKNYGIEMPAHWL